MALVHGLFLSYNGSMLHRYEITRSAANGNLHLVYAEGGFECLPFEVRLHAPWIGGERFDIKLLRAEQRWEIARQGYAILRDVAALSKAA